jgi:ribosomal-protein-alanine N-acetyltransferase
MTVMGLASGAALKDDPLFRLRTYRPADFEILYEIDQKCFPPGIAYGRGELASFIASPHAMTWVAEVRGAVVGFVIAERENEKIGHVVTIDVIEQWRHRGVGRELMNTAEDWACRMGAQFMYLETAEDNLPAQRFYEARGYERLEKIESYYASGQAAWVMVKWLK